MKIKVCGLMRPDDVRLSCELGAWACGLIFAPDSPRRLRLDRALELRAEVFPGTLSVGVFKGNEREDILKTIAACRLDAIQLYAAAAAELAGYPVPVLWAAQEFPQDMPRGMLGVVVEPERAEGDRIRGKRPDAQAQAAAWAKAAELKKRGSFVVLAGGLDSDNVAAAVSSAGPDAVDISSGVESKPGEKDAQKLRRFFASLRT
ncbi:MAG: phosphoribosylanthranilate isomerase [Elusimicrobia bacterium]|nr:phosphoribosylanthranilate isomerase [Elusimicrobiota bacterium]